MQNPDLVVLDVQMPGMDGFGVPRRQDPPHVIFATAYDQHAIKAFEVEALDYLLKPFSPDASRRCDRPRAAEDRRRARAQRRRVGRSRSGRTASAASQIPVHTARKILVVPVRTSSGSWSSHGWSTHVDGRSLMTNFTLRELEERLDPQVFFARTSRDW